jgi:hypothetical protein
VMEGALEQRAAKNSYWGGKLACELFPFPDGLHSCHR